MQKTARKVHSFSREKIVHRILNIWINSLNFYHFPQFSVKKNRVDNHLIIFYINNVPTIFLFYRLIVIITLQHVNWTHSMSFSILLISTECAASLLSFRYPTRVKYVRHYDTNGLKVQKIQRKNTIEAKLKGTV